jgi:hypothetical protein
VHTARKGTAVNSVNLCVESVNLCSQVSASVQWIRWICAVNLVNLCSEFGKNTYEFSESMYGCNEPVQWIQLICTKNSVNLCVNSVNLRAHAVNLCRAFSEPVQWTQWICAVVLAMELYSPLVRVLPLPLLGALPLADIHRPRSRRPRNRQLPPQLATWHPPGHLKGF